MSHRSISPDSDCDTGKVSLSKANRRIAKPIMEKKRRARINASLNELKALLVEVLQKEGCRHSSKMEKADILEMAVRHLKNLQRQQPYGTQTHTLRDSYPPAIPLEKYAAALPPECLPPEMGKYLGQTVSPDSKPVTHPTSPDSTTAARIDSNRTILPAPKPINVKPQLVQNPVMTRTANGEIAVVLPQHLLNQAGANNNNGLVVPLYTLSSAATAESAGQQQQPVMLSINVPLQQSPNSAFSQTQSSASSVSSFTSSSHIDSQTPISPGHGGSPVSPVWRPW